MAKPTPSPERDFLKVIQAKLTAKQESGELARWQQAMTTQALDTLKHPTPIPGISRATRTETRYYDPSVTATHDSHDADGKLIVKAGTRANPLDYLGFSKVLLFIDARDPQQTAYADQYYRDSRKPVKVVLVGGSWLELMRQWQRPVFYDQKWFLTSRLAITRVPALVYQESPGA
ncbi:type-F conjugative transfer system protein TraW [Thiothrix subterranea]|uniref:type-F conjugative transfer system protein TraW n=1 Tax=Thiothrix subterranea TaxID=2735563 RepID=UPI00280B877F|nr:type-F conjugative transfer system protein TraW [Thiothrix subterranea]